MLSAWTGRTIVSPGRILRPLERPKKRDWLPATTSPFARTISVRLASATAAHALRRGQSRIPGENALDKVVRATETGILERRGGSRNLCYERSACRCDRCIPAEPVDNRLADPPEGAVPDLV